MTATRTCWYAHVDRDHCPGCAQTTAEIPPPSAGAALAELSITADSQTHPYLIQVRRGGRLIAYAIRDAYGWAITARTGRRIRTVARATQRWGVEAALMQYAVTGYVPGGLEVPR
jgi:hypothetical protein